MVGKQMQLLPSLLLGLRGKRHHNVAVPIPDCSSDKCEEEETPGAMSEVTADT